MRRDYGSLLASPIDMPQTDALRLQIMCACYMAVLKWEPRVSSVTVTTWKAQFNGRMIADVDCQYPGTPGQPLSLTIP